MYENTSQIFFLFIVNPRFGFIVLSAVFPHFCIVMNTIWIPLWGSDPVLMQACEIAVSLSADVGIETPIGFHTSHTTAITDYLTNGVCIEVAQHIEGHANTKTNGAPMT